MCQMAPRQRAGAMRINRRSSAHRCAPSSLRALSWARRPASAWLAAGSPTERPVAPHCVHDHRQLARHGDTALAVAGAFGDRVAPALFLAPALKARHQLRRRLVERASHISIAGLLYATLTSTEVPDCQRREVSPKQAATSRERRKRDGSSIAVMNESAVTGPTPGIAMKCRHSSLACHHLDDKIVQPAILPPQRRASRQHGVHQLGRQRIVRHRSAHRFLESPSPDLAQADAERPQRMSDGILQVENLASRLRRCVSKRRVRYQVSDLMWA